MFKKSIACTRNFIMSISRAFSRQINFIRRCFLPDLFKVIDQKDELLLKHLIDDLGANINVKDHEGNTPLHLVARKNDAEIAKYLIEKGANLEARNTSLFATPLHLASALKHTSIIEVLVQHIAHNPTKKVDFDSKDKYGDTPLHLAIKADSPDTITALLKGGADINQQDNSDLGNTPLGLAATLSKMDSLKCLIKNGADLNATDSLGYTPLQTFISKHNFSSQDISIVQYLIDNGAETNMITDSKDLLDLALQHEKVDIVNLLLANGFEHEAIAENKNVAIYDQSPEESTKEKNIHLERLQKVLYDFGDRRIKTQDSIESNADKMKEDENFFN